MKYTIWSLWNNSVSVPAYVVRQHKHAVDRETARTFARFMNKHFGREAGGMGRYLAGPVDGPPPVEAFE